MKMNNMKNIHSILLIILLSVIGLDAFASSADSTKVNLVYDVRFDMNFDNREFAKNNFSPAMTIFGARLTPSVGVAVKQPGNLKHKVMLGVDVMKDFGAPADSSLFRELNLYYQLDKKAGKTAFSLQAGIFPRSSMEAYYSEAFFSDSLRFYDNNLEGLLVKIHRPKAYYEVGCDWMGKYGTFRRERFMIFSSGTAQVAPILSLGYSAYLYHYSCSERAVGVVDNVLLNPYIVLDLADKTKMQTFSMRLGWLQAMQNDREMVGRYVFPSGAEFDLEVRKWNVGVRNEFFYGNNMMPYYHSKDPGGYSYSNLLYMGSPFYQVHDKSYAGVADRLEIYYAPQLGLPYLDFRISAIFHFNGTIYSGCRQMVSLNFNLQELLGRNKR